VTRRPTLLRTLALAVTASLALSACGSDDGSKGDEKSKGNDKAAGSESRSGTSASPTPSELDSSGRPKITFPSDAKNVFEYEKTGDAVKDAVLADSTLSVNSVDEAIFEASTGTKALGFYNSGKALEASITFVRRYIDGGDTWTGETRYFNYKVTLSGTNKAYVTYCSDESRSYIKNRKTNTVDKTPTTEDAYVLYNTALAKNAEGIWQTSNIVSNRGSKACQP